MKKMKGEKNQILKKAFSTILENANIKFRRNRGEHLSSKLTIFLKHVV